mgnify:CR=1 FL=1
MFGVRGTLSDRPPARSPGGRGPSPARREPGMEDRSDQHVAGRLGGALGVRRGEGASVLLAAAFFFCTLYGYFMLRPAREALGVERGLDEVRLLFVGTLLATLLANPVFSAVVARARREVFVPGAMRFFMLNIAGFATLFAQFPEHVGAVSGRVFYVWLSVFNLFLIAVFWAVMADTFRYAQSKRLYGLVAIGGTLGAIAGSYTAWEVGPGAAGLAERLGLLRAEDAGERFGTITLLVLSIVLFELAARLAGALLRRGSGVGGPGRGGPPPFREPIGGSAWAGITRVARSPYLLGISGYVLITAVMSTFLYFTQLAIVRDAGETTDERTALFANINLWTQVATLAVQVLVTGRLLRAAGVGRTLALLPVLTAGGFVALALRPSYGLVVLVEAGYKACLRGFTRPGRETLFTVVPREDRYKSKAFLDTFVYRAGDAASAGVEGWLRTFGMGLAAVAAVATPLALVWAVLGFALGVMQTRRAADRNEHNRSEALEGEHDGDDRSR